MLDHGWLRALQLPDEGLMDSLAISGRADYGENVAFAEISRHYDPVTARILHALSDQGIINSKRNIEPVTKHDSVVFRKDISFCICLFEVRIITSK